MKILVGFIVFILLSIWFIILIATGILVALKQWGKNENSQDNQH